MIPNVTANDPNVQRWVRSAANTINLLVSQANTDPSGLEIFCGGAPGASEAIGGGIAPENITLSAANSTGSALTGATGTPVFSILLDGSPIGTVTFGGTVGTVALSSTAITSGQSLIVTSPGTPDATLADITILLRD